MLQTVNMSNDPFRVGSSNASTTTTSRRRGPSPSSTFPAKLFKILSDPENSHIITWMPHGRSWRMLQPTLFSEKVAPKYFSHQSKYSSFMRQVNGWGFKRITRGPDRNSYYHELFIRDEPQLARTMSRRSSGSDKSSKDADDIEPPNFYEMTGTSANPAGHVHGSHGSEHVGMNHHNPSGSHSHHVPHGLPPHNGGTNSILGDDPHHQHRPMSSHSGAHTGASSMHDRHSSHVPSHNNPVPGTDMPPTMAYDSMAYYGYPAPGGYSQHQVYPPPWAAYPLPAYPYPPSHGPPDHMGAPPPLSSSASASNAMRSSSMPPHSSSSVNDYDASTGAASQAGGTTNAPSSGGGPPHPTSYPASSHHDGSLSSPWYGGYGQPYGPPSAQQAPAGQGYNYYPSYPPHPPSSYSGGGGYNGAGASMGTSGPEAPREQPHHPHYGDLSQQHHSHHDGAPTSSPSHGAVHGSPSNPSDPSAMKYFDSTFSRIEGVGSNSGLHSTDLQSNGAAIKEEVGNGRGQSSPSSHLLHQRQSSSQHLSSSSGQQASDSLDGTGKMSFKVEHPYDQLF